MALTLGDNFSYQGAKPLDARLKYDTLANMKAVADATMYDGCMAYCVATDKTYQWKSTNTVDPDTGKWREFSSGGGGGGSYTAGDGIDITEDVISVDPMPAEDMDEVISPLPSIQPRYHKYSTEEHIVGEWIDGSTLYEKTIALTAPTVTTAGTYVTAYADYNVPTIDTKFISEAFLIDGDNISRPLIYILNAGHQIKVSLTATRVQIVSGIVEYSGRPMYVTMRYTKS